MKREEKSDKFMFWNKEEKKFVILTQSQINEANEMHNFLQKSYGSAEAREKHLEQMAKELECSTFEYELYEKIIDKLFSFLVDDKGLSSDDALEITNEIEYDIIDALKLNKGKK